MSIIKQLIKHKKTVFNLDLNRPNPMSRNDENVWKKI